MEPVNLNKSEPVNVGPIQSGRPTRVRKPKRQRLAKQAAWSPDLPMTIIAIAVIVILAVGGSFAVRNLIGTSEELCSQANGGSCPPGQSSGWDVPIFQ